MAVITTLILTRHGDADGRPWDEIKTAFGGPPRLVVRPRLRDVEPVPRPR
jgi:hypothetical protein